MKNNNQEPRPTLKEILSTKNSIAGMILIFAGIIVVIISYIFKWRMLVSILGVVVCSAGTQTIMNEIRDKS